MDERNRALLINLTKRNRTGTFISTKDLKHELQLEFSSAIVMHRHIRQLREWLGDDVVSPKILEQTGVGYDTRYRLRAEQAYITQQNPEQEQSKPIVKPSEDSLLHSVPVDVFQSESSDQITSETEIKTDRKDSAREELTTVDPNVLVSLRQYYEAIADSMPDNARWTGALVQNKFRGLCGSWNIDFYRKAERRGVINFENLRGKRNYHPSYTREDVLMLLYFSNHRIVFDNPKIKPDLVRTVIQLFLDDMAKKEQGE